MAESSASTVSKLREHFEAALRFRAAAGLITTDEHAAALWAANPGEYLEPAAATDPRPDVMGALESRAARITIMRQRVSRHESPFCLTDGWRDQSRISETLGTLAAAGANSVSPGGEGCGNG